MKTKQQATVSIHTIRVILMVIGLILTTGWSYSAVIVTFGETVPVTNIITSYEPGLQTANAWFNDGVSNNGNRVITESFITPGGSNYSASAISMKFNMTLATNFPGSLPFSIDFYQLTTPGQSPVTGTYLSSRGGYMAPTTSNATAGSYFTFTLDTSLALTAGVSYAYVLAFDTADAAQLLRLAVSDGAADSNGTRAWQNTNGVGWVNTSETYVYYIQGTAVPEPGTAGLMGMAVVGLFVLKRKIRSLPQVG